MEVISTFSKSLRLSNPWNYKVPLLLAFPYFFLLTGGASTWYATMSFLAAIATTIGFAGFGYVTNDLSDHEKDIAIGKQNSVERFGKSRMYLMLIAFLVMAVLPWLYLPMNWISFVLIGIELVLFVIYAFPPLRLKEKGILGVVVDALYAHVIPAVLASWTFFLVGGKSYPHFKWFVLILVVWQFTSGIRNILFHQLMDVENDRISGTQTFVTKRGVEATTRSITRLILPLELVLFTLFCALISFELYGFWFVVLLLWMRAIYRFNKAKHSELPNYKIFANEFLDYIYTQWVPFLLLFGMIPTYLSVRYILLAHIILFKNPVKNAPAYFKGSWPVRKFHAMTEVQKGIVHTVLFLIICTGVILAVDWIINDWFFAYPDGL